MKTRIRTRTKILTGTFAAILTIAMLGSLSGAADEGEGSDVRLTPMAGAPNASGNAEIELTRAVLHGSVNVEKLPPQPFGSGHFYGVWFVRTDTGNKAFLGALIRDDSIILSKVGDGATEFAATEFTTGPAAGSAITLGPAGTNLIIVLIENRINGLTPSPIGPVPGTGAAVAGTF